MGQRFAGESFVNAHAIRRRVVPALQEIFVFFRARAERNEERARTQNAARALTDEILTLLRDQP